MRSFLWGPNQDKGDDGKEKLKVGTKKREEKLVPRLRPDSFASGSGVGRGAGDKLAKC